ncbi:hypothetical protein [Sporosarcina sp. FSL K6-3457]|uniref:hypothetical protein n=1 Tax=Sporosarcina sp. FSL K6-3457 TaxID=2978204 RepID=UPI0030FA26F6
MSKNNKKTMNERTHNGSEIYKYNKNSNSNNNNLNEEFAAEFDAKSNNNVTSQNNEKRPTNNK